ncbi:MAG: hypothetical protein JXR03_21535 [Cyclobacteriaceae bacterium]
MNDCECLLKVFQNQSLSETIEVLDEMLYLIVLNIELMDSIPDKLTHQYLTIRELRDFFIDLNQQEHGN